MEHTGGTRPRLRPVLDLHSHQVKAANVCLCPFPARTNVNLEAVDCIGCYLVKLSLIHEFRQIGIMISFCRNLFITERNHALVIVANNLDLHGISRKDIIHVRCRKRALHRHDSAFQ